MSETMRLLLEKVTLVVQFLNAHPEENEQTHCVYSVQKGSRKSKILAAHCELIS